MDRGSCCDPPQADFVVQQLKSIPNIGWLTSTPASGMVSVSPTVAELVGRSSESQQLPIAEFIDAIDPADRPQVAAILTDPSVEKPTKSSSEQGDTESESTDRPQTHREQTGEKASAAKTNNATGESSRRQFEIEFQVSDHTENTETPPSSPRKKTGTDHTQPETAAGTAKSSQANVESKTQTEAPVETTGLGVRVRMRGEVLASVSNQERCPDSNQDSTADTDSPQHVKGTDTATHSNEKTDTDQERVDEEVRIQAVIEIDNQSQAAGGMSADLDKPHPEETATKTSPGVAAVDSTNTSTNKEPSPPTTDNTQTAAEETTRPTEHTIKSHHIEDLFSTGPVSVVRWDADSGWSVQYASENIESVLGHSKNELERGDPPYEQIIHQDDLQQVTRRVKSETESGAKFFQHKPYRILTATGEVRWVLDTTHIIRDDDGTVESYLGYLIDVTQERQNQLQLKQAEKIGSIGSWRLDTQNNEVYWSEGMCEIFELHPDNAPETLNQSLAYFQPEDRKQLQEIYQQPIEKELENKEFQIQIEDESKWIEISSKNVRNGSETVVSVVGNIKDITDRVEQRQNAEIINQTLQSLNTISSPASEEVINTVAGCVEKVFNTDKIGAHVFTDEGSFRSVKRTGDTIDTVIKIKPENDVLWDAFVSDEIKLIDEEAVPSAQLPDENPGNRILAVPVGNRGLILAITSNEFELKERTIERFKSIILAATETLSRLDQMEKVQQQQTDLEENITSLEQEKSLNQLIRSLMTALMSAETRNEVFRLTCEKISSYDGFDGVWIGENKPDSEQIVSIAESAQVEHYLKEADLSLDSDTPEPTTQVIHTQSTVGPIDTTEYLSNEQWATIAAKHGYQSVMAVPIKYNELVYGSMSVVSQESNIFTGDIASLLSEIGSLLGYVLNNLEAQLALTSEGHQNVEYDLEIDTSDPVAKLSNSLSHEIKIYNISQNNNNSTILHCEISGAENNDLTIATDNIEGIFDTNHIKNDLYEINIISPSIANKITKINGICQEIIVSNDKAILIITSNNRINQAQTTRRLNELFDYASIKAKTDVPISDDISWPIILSNLLSDKQETVLRTAYYSGYFDEQRKRTGGEIAESIGIAQPTFSNRLRVAQRNLFAAIWD